MRKRIAIIGLSISLFAGLSMGCTSKNATAEEPSTTNNPTTEQAETTQNISQSTAKEEIKLNGTTTELYAASEEQMLMMLNEADQQRLQKAIQIVSNNIAETVDLYTEEDDIDFDQWQAIYCKKVDGLTFTGIIQLAEQLLIETKREALASIKKEIADTKAHPSENLKDQEENLSILQEDLKKTKDLPTTIDTYVYNEECFL